MLDSGNRNVCVRIFKNGDGGTTDEWGDSVGPTDLTVIETYHVKMIARKVSEKISGDADTPSERFVMIGLRDLSITDEMFVEWEQLDKANSIKTVYSIENVDHKRDMDETHCLITTAKGRFDEG